MSVEAAKREWRRLYKDFEAQASQYHDLTLSVDYLTADHRPELPSEKPNYAAVLWQFFGNAGHDFNIDEFVNAQPTNYGPPARRLSPTG